MKFIVLFAGTLNNKGTAQCHVNSVIVCFIGKCMTIKLQSNRFVCRNYNAGRNISAQCYFATVCNSCFQCLSSGYRFICQGYHGQHDADHEERQGNA